MSWFKSPPIPGIWHIVKISEEIKDGKYRCISICNKGFICDEAPSETDPQKGSMICRTCHDSLAKHQQTPSK